MDDPFFFSASKNCAHSFYQDFEMIPQNIHSDLLSKGNKKFNIQHFFNNLIFANQK